MENRKNAILSDAFERLTVYNVKTGEEIAVIAENADDVFTTTVSEDIVIKLKPKGEHP